jgi:hypothetical protein
MSSALNGISMVIWSLVAAKAKQGYDASSSKDTSTVGSALERVGSLILMIVVAAGCNIYSQMESHQGAMETPKLSMPKLPILTTASPSVESQEPLSSHHEGGVAAAAFKAIAENPEILKQLSLMSQEKPVVKAVPASQRGQVLNIKPKFANVGNKAKRLSATDVINTSPSDLFAELSSKFTFHKNKLTEE